MLVRPWKGFTATCAVFENIEKFGFFELQKDTSVQKAQECGKGGRGKRKFEMFSKTAQVIVYTFQGRTNETSTFFFPRSDRGMNVTDFGKNTLFH